VTDPTVPVARDLAEITRLSDDLEAQAINHGDNPSLPGGDALVALAPVASPEAHGWRVWTGEHGLAPYPAHVADEDPDDLWPPLQLLLFWSEQWRVELAAESDLRPTIVSEAGWLRGMLGWAWEQTGWEDFASDVRRVRVKLEALIGAGRANRRGVRCLSCETPLERRSHDRDEPTHCAGHDGVCTWPHRYCPHDRGGLADEWQCPGCWRRFTDEDYRRAVAHTHLAWADWLPLQDCAERTGVRAGTISVWAHRGKVAKRREDGRWWFRVEDVEHAAAPGGEVA
jgi:hypothetical protein